ncbi:MAG: hypothetical protein EAX86_06570 [Candidatus Heimdallarchaeota archaeon]|nr:hypothetical protein [Candidatus Heimdallarchaeota archaeon]
MTKNTEVNEGWTGPGKYDTRIKVLPLSEDSLHIDMNKRGMYEWWYFDAHLDNGYTLVVFFYAKYPNPGLLQGKIGVEITLIKPDGKRIQKVVTYSKSDFSASQDKPEVTIGKNKLRVEKGTNELPVYEIYVNEKGLACHIIYKAEVNGWKPGSGLSHFGNMGYFGWVVPFARAKVEGTITEGNNTIEVTGIGYHDHNWLNFPFQSIINYWMWGRIYSENFTVSYAFIQCNEKVANHQVKVLMLAEGQDVILSTGEFDFLQAEFSYNTKAKHRFPEQITIHAADAMKVVLKVKKILEAQDMLLNFNPVFRLLAKYLMRIQPGYFRLVSDFELDVTRAGKIVKETGATLHEIVIFKPL